MSRKLIYRLGSTLLLVAMVAAGVRAGQLGTDDIWSLEAARRSW